MIHQDASRSGTYDACAASQSDSAAKLRQRNNVHMSGHGSTTLIFGAVAPVSDTAVNSNASMGFIIASPVRRRC